MATRASPLQSSSAHHHRRLSSARSIRLLHLVPSCEPEAILNLTLTEVNLDCNSADDISYEALSYVWGSPQGTLPVVCDNQLLLVTPNCESALRHLRMKDNIRLLWVDSICIDQGNSKASIDERSRQVALMGEIYQKASRTLCWLGPGKDFTAEVMRHLERIGSCASQRALKKLLLLDERLRQEGKISQNSSALNHIFCHPWHSRVWTVQEASFSQDCQIVCGNRAIPWIAYFKAARFLLYEEFIEKLDLQAYESYIGLDVRNTLRDYVQGLRVTKQRADQSIEDIEDEEDRKVVFLSSCLTSVNLLHATEPRDKIYGLHALYSKLGIPLPLIDYGKPTSSVYEEAAIAMITWSRKLRILGDACREHILDFPSWVPNFSDSKIKISQPSGSASKGSKIAPETLKTLSTCPGELRVKGMPIGEIVAWNEPDNFATVFPTQPEQFIPLILVDQIEGMVEDVETLRLLVGKIMFFRQVYRLFQANEQYCGGDAEDTFLDLMNQDSYSEPDAIFNSWIDILEYPGTNYDLSFGEELVRKWMLNEPSTTQWTTELTNCAIIIASLISNQVRQDGTLEDNSGILDLIQRFTGNLNDKSLILVELGSLKRTAVGTGPHWARAKDSVVLLEGAEWPVVLRAASGKWQFIGPAYVTGIMDGEAWVSGFGSSYDPTEFILI